MNSSSCETDKALQVEAITVRTGRIVCDVCIPNPHVRFTSSALLKVVCAAYPDIAHHACVNDKGNVFAAVMNHTSLAHLLEHLVISLQVRSATNDDASFQGTTEWTDFGAGKARVQISFEDDLVALRAFTEAVSFLNDAVVTCTP